MCGILISSPSPSKTNSICTWQAEAQREEEPLTRNLAAFSYYFLLFFCDFKDKPRRLVLRLVETT